MFVHFGIQPIKPIKQNNICLKVLSFTFLNVISAERAELQLSIDIKNMKIG